MIMSNDTNLPVLPTSVDDSMQQLPIGSEDPQRMFLNNLNRIYK